MSAKSVPWNPQAQCLAHWAGFSNSGKPHKNHTSAPPQQPVGSARPQRNPESQYSPPIQAFDKNYITANKNAEAFETVESQPSYLDSANKLALKALAHAGLSGRPEVGKNIILASPHPGASIFMERTAKAVAKDVGADIMTLDYVDVLSAVAELQKGAVKDAAGDKEGQRAVSEDSVRREVLTLSQSFSPASYYIERDEDELDEEDELEEHENDEEDHLPRWADARAESFRWMGAAARQPAVPLVVTLNVSDTKSDRLDDSSASGKPAGTPSHPFKISVNNPSASQSSPSQPEMSSAQKASIKGSLYDEHISEPQLRDFSTSLLTFIAGRCASLSSSPFTNLQSPRRIVLYLKDTTDILDSAGESGRKLVICLLRIVEKLRHKAGIPIVLMTGCSPSLLLPGNLSRARDLEFFEELFSGKAETMDSSLQNRIWSDGKLFATPLDKMVNTFDKVELIPPAAYLLAPKAPKDSDFERQRDWLKLMEQDMAVRIADMNLRRVELSCLNKNIAVDNLDRVMALSALKHTSDKAILHQLEEELWDTHRIERLVHMAIGLQLQASCKQKSRGPPQLAGPMFQPKPEDFAEAIKIFNNSRRPAPMSNIWPESGARPSDGKDGDDAFGANTVGTENVASAHSTTSHDQTAQAETVLQQFKREGVQLNTYEKKLLSTVVNPASISVNFSDLVLPAQTKLLLQTLTVLPIVRPTYFEKGILSRHSMSGVLLFGPPGTGKTLLAKALAKHSSARFMSVALSDIYDKYVGEGEKNVKAIFTLARKVKPCVVFIDEVDALFGRRGGVGDQGARREVMNEFMSEWDGLLGDNQGLVIVGATNRPFDLDDAILRRMPRRILVDLPKQAQRQQILALHLRDESLSPTLDLAHWAARTEKYSGSDLKNLCIAAALARIRDAVGGDEGLETLVISSRPATDSDSSDIPKSPQTKAASLTTDKIDVLPPLDSSHFETAIKQVAASLTDEMQTLIELRKWDQMYGEKKDGASKKVGWGFSHQ
ncbi:hypothetical protein PhCBS80983_g02828 [Powellomyces hirtus]|uniref:AAA+ ATPase domain-containing protein n=1 Tax=Powellomyces hirtus TaxID=109895 RepID=A0A507E548_9FUNG|nr:hypothetical protein PhCBS80983_g02828 [Powellomyces hirtus]